MRHSLGRSPPTRLGRGISAQSPGADEADWEWQELAEKEAEYRRNPPPVVAADRERDREELSDFEPEYPKRDP